MADLESSLAMAFAAWVAGAALVYDAIKDAEFTDGELEVSGWGVVFWPITLVVGGMMALIKRIIRKGSR